MSTIRNYKLAYRCFIGAVLIAAVACGFLANHRVNQRYDRAVAEYADGVARHDRSEKTLVTVVDETSGTARYEYQGTLRTSTITIPGDRAIMEGVPFVAWAYDDEVMFEAPARPAPVSDLRLAEIVMLTIGSWTALAALWIVLDLTVMHDARRRIGIPAPI